MLSAYQMHKLAQSTDSFLKKSRFRGKIGQALLIRFFSPRDTEIKSCQNTREVIVRVR